MQRLLGSTEPAAPQGRRVQTFPRVLITSLYAGSCTLLHATVGLIHLICFMDPLLDCCCCCCGCWSQNFIELTWVFALLPLKILKLREAFLFLKKKCTAKNTYKPIAKILTFIRLFFSFQCFWVAILITFFVIFLFPYSKSWI